MAAREGGGLTVVLPNFNHGHLIGRALEALANQERPADEIIAIDDASSDDSLEILERYARTMPALVILKNENNEGVVGALRRGLKAARGEYIYFAASDDWVLPGFFQTAASVLDANPECGLVCGEAMLRDGDTGALIGFRPAVRPRLRGGMLSAAMCRDLLSRADNFILTGSALFRRSAVLDAGGLDPRAGSFADGLLTRKIAFTRGFYFEPKVFAIWSIFSQGYSRTTATDIERARGALETIPSIIEADPAFPSWYAARFKQRWRFAVARLALVADPPRTDLALAVAARSRADRRLLSALAPWMGRRIVRWAAMGFLAARLRPYRLSDLIATAMVRRVSPGPRE